MRKKKLNYVAAEEEIRRIAAGRNEQCRTVTWREAVEMWEEKHGEDAHARAAFFAYIGIATTDECALLDELDADVPEEVTEA